MVFGLKATSKPFSKKFLSPMFDLNKFKCFASLFQITVLTSSFKNLQKTEKYPFQTHRTFIFQLQVAWKSLFKRNGFFSLSEKTVLTSSLKNLQKTQNSPFERPRTMVFGLIVTSKPFSKRFLSPIFDLNNFKRFALLFQITVLTSSFKNLQKTEKYTFQTLRTFIFEFQIAWESLSKRLPMINFWFKYFSTLCLTFPENGFEFVTQKFGNHCPFQTPRRFVYELKVSSNQFLRCFLWSIFDLASFECFASLSQKTVWTSALKSFETTQKCSFQTPGTFVFELKVVWKPFSMKLCIINFRFK